MKVIFFITFLVLTVAELATARSSLESTELEDNKDSINENSEEKNGFSPEQEIIESTTFAVEPVENTTIINLNIEKVNESSSEDLEKSEEDEKSALNETETIEVIVEREGKDEKKVKPIIQKAGEEINLDENEQNINTTTDSDVKEIEEEHSKEKKVRDRVEIGVHHHRNAPSEEQDIEEVIFGIEPVGIKTSHKSDTSSASDEDTSKVETSRKARPDILLERRLMMNHELMQKKLAAVQALDAMAKMGSSRNYAGDLSSHATKLYNAPLHHQPFSYNPTSPHENPALFYQDNVQHIADSQQRAGFKVNLESNSYPYTPPANSPESRVVNTIVHLPYQGYHNFYDHNYSPVKNPIIVGANSRLKRNAVDVDIPSARYPIGINGYQI